MELRRIRDYDGGNHLISDYMEYRDGPGKPWSKVQIMTSYESMLDDLHDGTSTLDDLPEASFWRTDRGKKMIADDMLKRHPEAP